MIQRVKTQILGGFSKTKYRDQVCVKNPKKNQKSVCLGFSTGTKSSKTAQKSSQKIVKLYPLPTLKIQKNFKVGSGYCIRDIPVYIIVYTFNSL